MKITLSKIETAKKVFVVLGIVVFITIFIVMILKGVEYLNHLEDAMNRWILTP